MRRMLFPLLLGLAVCACHHPEVEYLDFEIRL